MTTNSESAEMLVSQSLDIGARFLAEHNRFVRALDPSNMTQSVKDAVFAMERTYKYIRDALESTSKVTKIQKANADSAFPHLQKAVTQLLMEAHSADTPVFKEQVIGLYAPRVAHAANFVSMSLIPKAPAQAPRRIY